MANNRLYLFDPNEDGEKPKRFLLAKSLGAGWVFWYKTDIESRIQELDDWLISRDTGASYGDARATELSLITEREILDSEPDPTK